MLIIPSYSRKQLAMAGVMKRTVKFRSLTMSASLPADGRKDSRMLSLVISPQDVYQGATLMNRLIGKLGIVDMEVTNAARNL